MTIQLYELGRLYRRALLGLLLAMVICWDGHAETADQVQAIIEQHAKEQGITPIAWASNWIADVRTAVPQVPAPTVTVTVAGADVGVSFDGPVVVSVSDKLRWRLSMGPWTVRGVVPALDAGVLWRAGGIGLGVGLLAGCAGTLLALALTGHLR